MRYVSSHSTVLAFYQPISKNASRVLLFADLPQRGFSGVLTSQLIKGVLNFARTVADAGVAGAFRRCDVFESRDIELGLHSTIACRRQVTAKVQPGEPSGFLRGVDRSGFHRDLVFGADKAAIATGPVQRSPPSRIRAFSPIAWIDFVQFGRTTSPAFMGVA